mmetsp:Transcript_4604/g.7017  ORF Transcript_4604/g.7017 Transcript_4604/m.7017 type:complete len:88 (-) Transcript_4604:985-1248(-)
MTSLALIEEADSNPFGPLQKTELTLNTDFDNNDAMKSSDVSFSITRRREGNDSECVSDDASMRASNKQATEEDHSLKKHSLERSPLN